MIYVYIMYINKLYKNVKMCKKLILIIVKKKKWLKGSIYIIGV